VIIDAFEPAQIYYFQGHGRSSTTKDERIAKGGDLSVPKKKLPIGETLRLWPPHCCTCHPQKLEERWKKLTRNGAAKTVIQVTKEPRDVHYLQTAQGDLARALPKSHRVSGESPSTARENFSGSTAAISIHANPAAGGITGIFDDQVEIPKVGPLLCARNRRHKQLDESGFAQK